MLKVGQLYNKPVFVPKDNRRARSRAYTGGSTNQEVSYRKIGRVHMPVFDPEGIRVVGFLIKRPDIALMVKRDDIFIGIDAVEHFNKGMRATRGKDSFDNIACERLGLSWDACVMWMGMDVVTTDGHNLGYVNDAVFDERTGEVSSFIVGEERLSRQLIGSLEIPPSMLCGYKRGRMVVDRAARNLRPSGGVAARAGEASARVAYHAKVAQEKFDENASAAIDKGSHEFGRMISRTKRAFKEASTGQSGKSNKKVQSSVREAKNIVVETPRPHVAITGEVSSPSKRRTFEPIVPTSSATTRPHSTDKQNFHPQTTAHKQSSSNTAGKALVDTPKAHQGSPAHNNTRSKSARDKAERALGKQIGQLSSMFSAAADEYKKARK